MQRHTALPAFAIWLISALAAAQTPPAQPPKQPGAPPATTPAVKKPAARKPAAPASAVTEFQPIVERLFAARSTRRLEIIMGNYAAAGGPFFDVAPARYDSWESYRAGLEAQFGRFASLTFTPGRDLKASRAGSLAWTAVSVRAGGTRRDGVPVNLEARHSAVWSRDTGEWTIVHEHLSVPSPASAGVPEPTPTATTGDQEAVKDVFKAYEEAWNAGTAERLAALWDEQGDAAALASGAITTGRAAVQQLWEQSFSRRGQQKTPTTLTVRVSTVRFLSATHALVDGVFEYRAGPAAAAQERFTSVIGKTRDGWKIASTRVSPAK